MLLCVLVTGLVAVTKHLTIQLKARMVYLGSQFRVTVQHGGVLTVAGALMRQLNTLSVQSDRDEHCCCLLSPFSAVEDPRTRKGPPTFRMGLLTLINLIYIIPHRHAQRLVS